MSVTATLTNCYVPLPIPSSHSDFDPSARSTDDESTPRGPRTLRRIRLSRSIFSQSTGSSLVEWGHTKLMVSVRGPRPVPCASLTGAPSANSALLCEVQYLPNIGIRMETLASHSLTHDLSSKTPTATRPPRETLSTSQDTVLLSSGGSLCSPIAFLEETYLSHRLYEALAPAVMYNGKMCIEVFVQVLQSDGGVLGAAILGASLALVDAGVEMRDVVCASSAAVLEIGDRKNGLGSDWVAIADPTEEEILQASGVVTVAMMPNLKEVTVWDQFGKMTVPSCSEAIELARDGCLTMHKFLKNCLEETLE